MSLCKKKLNYVTKAYNNCSLTSVILKSDIPKTLGHAPKLAYCAEQNNMVK